MKRTITLLAALLLLPMAAMADSFTHLSFEGTGPYKYNSKPSYPYFFDALNTGQQLSLMCVTPNRSIGKGESWWAFNYNVTEYANFLNTSGGLLEAVEIAWLFQRAGNGSDSDYQGAVWFIDDSATSLTPGALALVDHVELIGRGLTRDLGQFNGIVFCVPQPGTYDPAHTPQIFVNQTPEPATLALLGSGIIGLGLRMRRKTPRMRDESPTSR